MDNSGTIENIGHIGDGIVNDDKPSLYSSTVADDKSGDATVKFDDTAYNIDIDIDCKDEEEQDILHEDGEYIDEEEESESTHPLHIWREDGNVSPTEPRCYFYTTNDIVDHMKNLLCNDNFA
eukprot:6914436-Ditylum_brightwellii.AAC.1